jgi:hypothetical protein
VPLHHKVPRPTPAETRKEPRSALRIVAAYANVRRGFDLGIENTEPRKLLMSKTSLDEQIANALVYNAVNDGFLISVNEREEMIVNRSRNVAEIIKAMFRTNIDTLTLNVEERCVGMITLIYGNGRNGLEVIDDHTDIPHINRLVENTMKEFEL